MLTLYIGDCTEELANNCNLSVLIEKSNYKKIIEKSKTQNIVGHTSLADMGKITQDKSPFYELLMSADNIEYVPPAGCWSDHSDKYQLTNMQRLTEYYLYDINRLKKNVNGLKLDTWTKNVKYLELRDSRKNHDKNLWICGCSISDGDAVAPNESFGRIIADALNLPVNWLTMGGSSISWAADQILRSDIRPGDIVVWGLTSEYRISWWAGDEVDDVSLFTFESIQKKGLEIYSEEDLLYKSLIAANQVTNFCQKIGVKLIMIPLLASEVLRLYLCENPCYLEQPYQLRTIDLGTDNLHPGPIQHQAWADSVLSFINTKKEQTNG